jgi:hypothetical protein
MNNAQRPFRAPDITPAPWDCISNIAMANSTSEPPCPKSAIGQRRRRSRKTPEAVSMLGFVEVAPVKLQNLLYSGAALSAAGFLSASSSAAWAADSACPGLPAVSV